MHYRVAFSPAADRALARLDRQAQRRIIAQAEALAENPRPPGCRKLSGADDLWRVRLGDYRLVYMIQDKKLLVLVVSVGHRKDIYRDR